MKKITLGLSLVLSTSVFADYKVYSAPQNKGGGSVVNVPSPNCMSDLSVLSDGEYVLCGREGNFPVVNGEAFEITPEKPLDGFSCLNGYANNGQALKLAQMTGDEFYTPLNSYMARSSNNDWIGYDASSSLAHGRAYYVNANGLASYSYMYALVNFYRASGPTHHMNYVIRPGTEETLLGPDSTRSYYTRSMYYSVLSSVVETKVANRACVINPV